MSRIGVGNDLLDNAKTVKRIICPAKHAFSQVNKIIEEVSKHGKDKLFILALGPTATVLAHRLSQKGYRALDMGHFDVEYEWMLMNATTRVPIPGKYVFESSQQYIQNDLVEQNNKYQAEIISKIL